MGFGVREIIVKIFPFNRTESFFYGIILFFVCWGLLGSFFTSWFKYDFWLMWLAFILTFILFLLINKFIKIKVLEKPLEIIIKNNNKDWPNIVWIIFYLVIISSILSVIIMAQGEKIFSPWDVLPWWFIVSVLFGFLFIFWSIVQNIKSWKILWSIIALSFLIHSYLLVYQNGFGGDRFRHLGSENRLLQGLEYQPTLLTKDLWIVNLGPLKIPQALIDRAKISYSFQWSIEVFLSQLTGIEIFQINKFILPIFWSLGFTFLVYLISLLIFSNVNKALISAIISNGFYLLQYYGAQGLPASYGVIVTFAIIPFWLVYLKSGAKKILLLAVIFTILSYFNYLLSFLVLVALGFLILLIKKNRWLGLLGSFVISLFILCLELFDNNIFDFFLIKIKSAWSAANLLYFNSLSRFSFVDFTLIKLFDLLVVFTFIFLLFYLFWHYWKKNNTTLLLFCIMFFSLTSAYFFSWVLFSGEHSLSRRLTLFSSAFFIFILVELIYDFIIIKKSQLVIIILSLLLTINFYSGPVLKINVTDRDWQKATAIWKDISKLENYPCIKDDLEVILALEAISAKRFQELINNNNCNNKF